MVNHHYSSVFRNNIFSREMIFSGKRSGKLLLNLETVCCGWVMSCHSAVPPSFHPRKSVEIYKMWKTLLNIVPINPLWALYGNYFDGLSIFRVWCWFDPCSQGSNSHHYSLMRLRNFDFVAPIDTVGVSDKPKLLKFPHLIHWFP